MAAKKSPKKKRHLSKGQKANAQKSANKHGRSKPGLWENVNASKNKGPGNKKKNSTAKGKTRPGKRSRKSKSKK